MILLEELLKFNENKSNLIKIHAFYEQQKKHR